MTKKKSAAERFPFIHNAWMVAAANVEIAQMKLQALQYATNPQQYGHSYRSLTKTSEAEFSLLHGMLYRELNDAYKELLMFGAMLGGDELREAKKMAYHHFLKEGMAISEYLHTPWRFAPKLDHDKEFRKELLAATECPYPHGNDDGCSAVELIRMQEEHESHVASLIAALKGVADLEIELDEEEEASAQERA